jgi:Zn-dependent M28 family amino/carboxypeptidase
MAKPHLDRICLTETEKASAARLYRHVDMLAGVIGERHCWRYEHLLAAEKYVRDHLAATGLEVTEQVYEVMGKKVRNLIAEQKGTGREDEILVVGGHYDSVTPTPGADDNASAVAGVLETARQLAGRKFRQTIRYVSFVNEEPPFYKGENMGSLRYAKQCRARREKIVGMINLEMIGYFDDSPGSQQYPVLPRKWWLPRPEKWLSDRGNFIVVCGDMKSFGLLRKFMGRFKKASGKFPTIAFPAPRWVEGPGMSDNWSFWECGYPALMVTDTSFFRNANYHTTKDTVETLCFPAMTRVVAGVAGAVAGMAGEIR